MHFRLSIAVAAALFAASSAPAAQAGLINPTSTVNPFYEFPPDIVAPSQVFNTGAPGPFSLAAPIDPPIHTTEIFNRSANAGFLFTQQFRSSGSVLQRRREHGFKLHRFPSDV